MDVVGLDFETFGRNLPVVGLPNYVEGPEFMVLCAAVARIDENGDTHVDVIDFVKGGVEAATEVLDEMLGSAFIVAHNSMFEYMVCRRLGIEVAPARFIDSAVIARIAGMGSSLEAAAPQALGVDKMASGKEGIQLFSIPGTYQMESGSNLFDPRVVEDNQEKWEEFQQYCAMDAALSLELLRELFPVLDENELLYQALTMSMNLQGWKVDVPLVQEMERRYQSNLDELLAQFRKDCDAPDLNLNSTIQMIKWCAERGVKATSFDEQHVSKMLLQLGKKLDRLDAEDPEREQVGQVLHLLKTKQAMGGAALKKLKVILNTTTEDGYLRDQYLHAGAGTTHRTSGRGVQLQNLKRFGSHIADVEELFDPGNYWSNEEMAHNLRQVFTARDPQGKLIVGDYSAVESRGLAWYAGEEWKLETYRQGLGVYEAQAARFYDIEYDAVTKEQRQFGKAGELSCGYQAGAVAVQGFGEKMGVPMSMEQAKQLVYDFRAANPEIVKFWHALQACMEQTIDFGMGHLAIPNGTITMSATPTVSSLRKETGDKNLKTLVVQVDVPRTGEDTFVMRRLFHGVSRNGKEISYWKPSARKTGDLWAPSFIDPKTKQRRNFTLYGGKMAGILTQSLCREIFMIGMGHMASWVQPTSNVRMIGQFHDELVVDWAPAATVIDPDLDTTVSMMEKIMSTSPLPGFPLACDVKYDYRYTK